jgi:ABC-type uncharacterized transport system permease subunit
MGSRAYFLVAVAFYAVAALSAMVHFLARRRTQWGAGSIATFIGFVVHTAGLSQRWTEAGRFPASGLHDVSSLLAWTMVLAFLVASFRSRVEGLGETVHPVAFALLLVAILTNPAAPPDPALRGLFMPIHTSLAALGYGALFVNFAMSVLYLLQERDLRARTPRLFYYAGPSLDRCDRMGGTSALVGFCFLTLAVVTGFLWNHHARGHVFTGDPKEWTGVASWFTYAGLVVLRHRSGWGGRRGAWIGIAGFAIVAATFLYASVIAGLLGRK